ncbi:MAG: hypothetical protein ACM3IJ_04580 [Candidatus Levyibacteriota bacterium]
MKLFKLFTKEKKKQNFETDLYQITVDKVGKEQLKELLKKGLHIPVVLL